MKEKIKEFLKTIKINFKTILLFEFIFKLLTSIIFIPIATNLFYLAMKITGFSYITLENIFKFVLNPITILFILLIIIYLTIITLFDYATISIIYDESYHNRKIGLVDSVYNSIYKCIHLFKFKNILVAFLVLFLIPFLNIGFTSNVITVIKIPEFITDFIYANDVLTILFIALILFLVFIFIKWIYVIQYMTIEDKSFKEAIKCSNNLSKKNKIKDIINIIIFQVLSSILYTIFVLIGILLIYLIYKILIKFKLIESIFISIIWIFIIITICIFYIFSNSINYMIISNLYYEHKKDKKEVIKENNYKKLSLKKINKINFKPIIISILALTIICGSVLTYDIISGKMNLNIENIKVMELTAHRGASTQRPENTMSAFVLAKELGADYIELDVQQTKDRKLVVSHDTNLSRICNVDEEIINLTYDEISKLDAGSYFDEKYEGEKIPLLSEVIEFARNNNIKLNIELKPTGSEVDFEKDVIELVNEYNFSNMCVITSQKYEVLENIKKIDKNIKTIYVMSIAIGTITDLEYADGFSLEASNVNDDIVTLIHNNGKEVYAWTINTEESINNMIDMGVDNIITDNVTLGRELLIKSKQTNFLENIIEEILINF